MEILEVKEETFDELYEGSALTIEGLTTTEENLIDACNYLEERCDMVDRKLYIISGKQMNEHYHLTGNNAYKDELSIVCFPLENFLNTNKLVLVRFNFGGRWFDDVVDNNKSREK